MTWLEQFDEIKSSALKELVNIGISHAATAIGEVTGEVIDVTVPELTVFSRDELIDKRYANGTALGVYLRVDGISNLTEALIFLSKEGVYNMMDKFVNMHAAERIDTRQLSAEEQKSIFQEVATIIAATYFSAIDSMFNLKTSCGVPEISFGDESLSDFISRALQNKEGINVAASLKSQKSEFYGNFVLIPEPHSLDIFFKALGLVY